MSTLFTDKGYINEENRHLVLRIGSWCILVLSALYAPLVLILPVGILLIWTLRAYEAILVAVLFDALHAGIPTYTHGGDFGLTILFLLTAALRLFIK
jgi:hypothetical protein